MESLNQLILEARNGSEDAFKALCEQYKPLLISMTSKFSQMCSEQNLEDDFLQEAEMALYSSVMTFDTERQGISFGFYLKRCIRNRLISCVRKLNSKKRLCVKKSEQDDVQTMPHESFILYENTKEFLSLAKDVLSKYELKIFTMYASGLRAKEISVRIGKSEKSVNNAIYRIRSKLKKKINGGT